MVKAVKVFDNLALRYDEWYDRNKDLYLKELSVIPKPVKPSIEVGVGSGRFAAPLSIDVGVDISARMLRLAKERGVECVECDAALLPFRSRSFNSAYIIFTLCFLERPREALAEVRRVLNANAGLTLCVIPADSGLGKEYMGLRDSNPFYAAARFYSESEVIELTESSGFKVISKLSVKLRYDLNDFTCYELKPKS